jgi:hypothetical protein
MTLTVVWDGGKGQYVEKRDGIMQNDTVNLMGWYGSGSLHASHIHSYIWQKTDKTLHFVSLYCDCISLFRKIMLHSMQWSRNINI